MRTIPSSFKITCPKDPTTFVIINTHVDDGGAILTWRSMYDKTLRALSDRYPGTLDSSAMDRYLGMGFDYNSSTGAMTASTVSCKKNWSIRKNTFF